MSDISKYLHRSAWWKSPHDGTPKAGGPKPAPRLSTLGRDTLDIGTRATTFDIAGLQAGQTYQVTGSVKGHGFKGQATVNAYDGNTIDMTMNVSAMFMRATLHGRLATMPDGTVHVLAEKISGPNLPGVPDKNEADLKVISTAPNSTVLQAENGSPAAVKADASGKIIIDFMDNHIELRR